MRNGVLHWWKPKINEEVEEYIIMVCLFTLFMIEHYYGGL